MNISQLNATPTEEHTLSQPLPCAINNETIPQAEECDWRDRCQPGTVGGMGNATYNGHDLIGLRKLNIGQKARIVRVQACGELGRRIRDMGLIPGTEIEIIGRAPLRDPVALRLPGFTLSLRNNEADFVFVQLI